MDARHKTKARRANHVLRWQANLLGLWGLCGNAKCRRAQACCGDGRDCMTRLAPLVPEEARAGVDALDQGRVLGLCFDSVWDQAPEEVDAVLEWLDLVTQSARR